MVGYGSAVVGLKVKGALGSVLVSTFSIRVKGECGLELKFKASGFVDCKHFPETCSDPPTPPRWASCPCKASFDCWHCWATGS